MRFEAMNSVRIAHLYFLVGRERDILDTFLVKLTLRQIRRLILRLTAPIRSGRWAAKRVLKEIRPVHAMSCTISEKIQGNSSAVPGV